MAGELVLVVDDNPANLKLAPVFAGYLAERRPSA
jgi:hypothetical protein